MTNHGIYIIYKCIKFKIYEKFHMSNDISIFLYSFKCLRINHLKDYKYHILGKLLALCSKVNLKSITINYLINYLVFIFKS